MESLYFLIPLAIIILLVIVVFFFWAVKSGQMDDLEGPAYRILMDDESVRQRTQDDATQPGNDTKNDTKDEQDRQH